MQHRPATLAFNPVSRYRDYCDGYGSAGSLGAGYINTLKLQTASVEAGKGEVLDHIVAYDRAERDGAYLGQINMVGASSFCGPEGWIWGYDLARPRTLHKRKLLVRSQRGGYPLPVYSADPLLSAAECLFGTEGKRRFPLYPGSFVFCAYKEQTTYAGPVGNAERPVAVWCYISVSIAADRRNSADLFIENTGVYRGTDKTTKQEVASWLETRMHNVIDSIVECGRNQSVTYSETFISWRFDMIPPGCVGTALTCAPYITLAQNAVVDNIYDMRSLSLEKWAQEMDARTQPAP